MREKVLIFGSNFPLATRIADLVKREFEVVQYAFSATRESGRNVVSTAFTGELLTQALAFHGAQYTVFTTEALMHFHAPATLVGFLKELQACKRLAGTRLACVEIVEPIVAGPGRRIEVLQGDSVYGQRLALLRQSLLGVADYVLQVQSVYSPEDDPWGQNFLRLLFDARDGAPVELQGPSCDWEALAADELAQVLVSSLGHAGSTRLTHGPYPGGLQAFCAAASAEYARWADSQALPPPDQDDQSLFTAHRKVVPIHAGLHAVARQTRCAVNYLYRRSPETAFGTRSVARFRYELGYALARYIPREVADGIDMVVPVPETGKQYAQGLAEGLDLPYVEAIYKSDRKRSFDIESFDVRREFLYSRLGVVPDLLAGKSVMVVDEAIFTGATLNVVSRLVREAGARSIYFAIPSPEARYACKFNMQPQRALLSEYVRKEDLWSYFNVQGVFFQDEEAFVRSIDQDGPQCVACFIRRGLS